jgi:hypothetical protein
MPSPLGERVAEGRVWGRRYLTGSASPSPGSQSLATRSPKEGNNTRHFEKIWKVD